MRNQRSVVSKIVMLFIFISIADIFLTPVSGTNVFQNFSPFVWVFVFFLGIRIIAGYFDRLNKQRRPIKDNEIYYKKQEEPKEKDEYAFDDEFAIDPKDYE